jgi:hypothetical protein
MTKKLKFLGAALLALAILPAAVMLLHLTPHNLFESIVWLSTGAVGVVTITYESFQFGGAFGGGYTGGATAPTQAQSAQSPTVVASVNFTDTDTTFTLTHNFNLSAAAVAALRPLVIITQITSVQALGVGIAPIIAVVVGANTVTFTKQQATGSGATVSIAILKPAAYGF